MANVKLKPGTKIGCSLIIAAAVFGAAYQFYIKPHYLDPVVTTPGTSGGDGTGPTEQRTYKVALSEWPGHMAMVVGSIAGLLVVLALLSPNVGYAAMERAAQGLASLIGRLLGSLVLIILFYTFFLPFGLLFRRARRDTLQRFFDSEAPTYWDERPAQIRVRTRQF